MEKLDELLGKKFCDFNDSLGKFVGLIPTPEQERARWENLFGGITTPIIGGLFGAVSTVYGFMVPSAFVARGIESLYTYDSLVEQVLSCGINFFTAGLVAATSLTGSIIATTAGADCGSLEREIFMAKSAYRKAILENDIENMTALEDEHDYLSEWARNHIKSYLPSQQL